MDQTVLVAVLLIDTFINLCFQNVDTVQVDGANAFNHYFRQLELNVVFSSI